MPDRTAIRFLRRGKFVELTAVPPMQTVLDYLRLQDRLLAEQVAFATPTVWEGEVIGRFALLHPSTTIEMVQAVLDAVH